MKIFISSICVSAMLVTSNVLSATNCPMTLEELHQKALEFGPFSILEADIQEVGMLQGQGNVYELDYIPPNRFHRHIGAKGSVILGSRNTVLRETVIGSKGWKQMFGDPNWIPLDDAKIESLKNAFPFLYPKYLKIEGPTCVDDKPSNTMSWTWKVIFDNNIDTSILITDGTTMQIKSEKSEHKVDGELKVHSEARYSYKQNIAIEPPIE